MRTTVDIPDEVYRELKSHAIQNGQTVKQLLLLGAEIVLREPQKQTVRRLKFPLIDSDDPGSLKIDNQQIYDLIDFPDINVWLAMTFRGHMQHLAANAWFESLTESEELVFSRITQLGLLRLLTNTAVMGNRVKTQREAWSLYDELLSPGTTRFLPEPRSMDGTFRKFANLNSASPHDWTDSYLAAFAEAAGLRLVTFDKALAAKAKGAILLHP